ncbi:MAG: helix-turn-helix domain-containing protein [Thermoanaerobaculia bacterium]
MRKLPSGQSGVSLLARRVGKRLAEIRRSQGISRRELATTLELPTASIEEYEKGGRLPRTYTLHQLSVALGVSAGELLDDDPPGGQTHEDAIVFLLRRLEKLPDPDRRVLIDFFTVIVTAFERLAIWRDRGVSRS